MTTLLIRRVLLPAGLLSAAAFAGCRRDQKAAVARVATTADSADQVMWGMGIILTDRGVQRAQLSADTGYFFDENTRIELRVLSTTFFGKDGTKSGVLTARRGTYNTRANVMEARQNVVIVGVDGKRLTSPMVRFEQFRNVIVSDSPFVLLEGERKLEGIGFESDPQMLTVKVRKISRATGASIVLPSGSGSTPMFRSDKPITAPPVLPPSAGVTPPPPVKP